MTIGLINKFLKIPAVTSSRYLIYFLIPILITQGCNQIDKFRGRQEDNVVARVHDKYLYREELSKIIQPGLSENDSIQLVKSYTQNWIRRQLILKKAEENLSENLKNVDRQLAEYRNSLITYTYETELIRQNLDTTVTKEEIEKYYNDNKDNFQLRDNIVKASFIKVNKSAPKVNQLRNWHRSNSEKERKLLDDYCNQYASDYSSNDTTWFLFDELLKKTPVKPFDKETFLRTNSFIEAEDSTDLYLVRIREFKTRETQSPLSFVEDDIRVIIVNRKKLELLREMEQLIYEEAQRKNEFEIYE